MVWGCTMTENDNVIDMRVFNKLKRAKEGIKELLGMEKATNAAIKNLVPYGKFNDIKNLIISLEDVRVNIRRAINTRRDYLKRLEGTDE